MRMKWMISSVRNDLGWAVQAVRAIGSLLVATSEQAKLERDSSETKRPRT
jgi:hypothetical protein